MPVEAAVFIYCEKDGDKPAPLDHPFVLQPHTMAFGECVTVVSHLLAQSSGLPSDLYNQLEQKFEYCELYVPLDALEPAFMEMKDRVLKGQAVAGSPVAAVSAKVNFTRCGRIRVYPINRDAFNTNLYATAVWQTRAREYSKADMTASNGTPMYTPVWREQHTENMHRLGRGKRSNNKPYWTPRKTKTTTPDTSNPAAASASPNQTGRPTDPVQQPANPANVDITSSKLGFDLQLQSLQGSTSSPKSAASEASSDSAWGSATPDRGRSPGVSYSSVAKGAGAAGVAACGAISSSPVVSPAKAAGKWRRV